jgi:hypothetical protein
MSRLITVEFGVAEHGAYMEHRYYSVVESVRISGRSIPYQKPLLYLAELSNTQQVEWTTNFKVFDDLIPPTPSLNLFPKDRVVWRSEFYRGNTAGINSGNGRQVTGVQTKS